MTKVRILERFSCPAAHGRWSVAEQRFAEQEEEPRCRHPTLSFSYRLGSCLLTTQQCQELHDRRDRGTGGQSRAQVPLGPPGMCFEVTELLRIFDAFLSLSLSTKTEALAVA